MPKNTLIDIECTLLWKSPSAQHLDCYHLKKVDLKSDIFALDFSKQINKLKIGESCEHTFQAKDLLGEAHTSHKIVRFTPDLFDTKFKGQNSPAILYRFYPSAIAHEGLNTEVNDYTPFRLLSVSADSYTADQNHPLAKYYLTMRVKKTKAYNAPENHRSRKRHIGKLVAAQGPGMQAPFEYGNTIFFKQYPFDKTDKKQLSTLIDASASDQKTQLYKQLLPEYSKVLDLMSGESSFLAKDYETGLLSGIGSDENTLCKNTRLDTYITQDLNKDKTLPYEANSFDDAICTLAIENLSNPLQIFKEVARVVNNGGKFVITFSAASKVDNPITSSTTSPATLQTTLPIASPITLWEQLHPFERMQLVLEYFKTTDLFEDLHTQSIRNIIPTHVQNKPSSVFAVWGKVKQKNQIKK